MRKLGEKVGFREARSDMHLRVIKLFHIDFSLNYAKNDGAIKAWGEGVFR